MYARRVASSLRSGDWPGIASIAGCCAGAGAAGNLLLSLWSSWAERCFISCTDGCRCVSACIELGGGGGFSVSPLAVIICQYMAARVWVWR